MTTRGVPFSFIFKEFEKEVKQKLVESIKSDQCNHGKELVTTKRQPHINDIKENNKILVKLYLKNYK